MNMPYCTMTSDYHSLTREAVVKLLEQRDAELNPSLTGIIIFHKFSVCFEGFRFAKYLIISRSVF